MASEISTSPYAARRKTLLALVNQLRAVGAQSDLDLPRITVIGNQSAGKSSVVEAISGINVPRDAGTCTRCPMECRLSSSSSKWSCRVSIRREFDKNNKPLDEVFESPFGEVITDKSRIELMLRRAQLSVLNPDIPISKVLNASTEELKSLSDQTAESNPFSRNVVCVDLEGPELTDLSFIDLPGLIQNADASIVQLVEDMVLSHIKGNCLILVALPVTDDIENQKALRLARQEDPDGKRTIGVLTKPDMLGAGATKALKNWLDVIEGRSRHQLVHGYYCTRQPDDAERSESITPTQARQNETKFFQTTAPWSKSTHGHRFGTENLISNLSRLLVRIIDDTLPRIRSEAILRLEECVMELSKLPSAVEEEPATYMLNLITNFASEIRRFVQGGIDVTELIRQHRGCYKALKVAIRQTAPKFVPRLAKEPEIEFANCLDEEEEDAGAVVLISENNSINLTEMRTHIEKSITRELPDNIPFEAKVALIQSFQYTWPSVVEQCFNDVEKSFRTLLLTTIDRHFARYEILRAQLRSFIHDLIIKHRERCQMFLEAALEAEKTPFTQNTHYLQSTTEKWLAKYKSIRARQETPSVEPPAKRQKVQDSAGGATSPASKKSTPKGLVPNSNKDAPTLETFTAFGPLSSPSPQTSSVTAAPKVDVNQILALLAQAGYTGLQPEDLGKLNPPDEYEQELNTMAQVRGYFQVAYKRIIDGVPSHIDSQFVRALSKELQSFLISKFELGTSTASERCAKYLVEDASLVSKREELTARRKRLESVQQQLINYGIVED
ncbi:hypothetical protein VKT23_004571 [Stygiomarasmius scandens]|uniref:P-loop containing nucleoside triphosphate hydrolase protein n=1 Tax=Marasmiellus scandens TaxID=2682957 RepID=A0ABR1JUH6_9AGAR